MKILLPLVLALAALSAHAQVYKWTDADGHIHYGDHPQDGVNAKQLSVPQAQAAPESPKDDWRERDRASRENWERQTEADRRTAAAQATLRLAQQPSNPGVTRSATTVEIYRRERLHITIVEKGRRPTVTHGAPQRPGAKK